MGSHVCRGYLGATYIAMYVVGTWELLKPPIQLFCKSKSVLKIIKTINNKK